MGDGGTKNFSGEVEAKKKVIPSLAVEQIL